MPDFLLGFFLGYLFCRLAVGTRVSLRSPDKILSWDPNVLAYRPDVLSNKPEINKKYLICYEVDTSDKARKSSQVEKR